MTSDSLCHTFIVSAKRSLSLQRACMSGALHHSRAVFCNQIFTSCNIRTTARLGGVLARDRVRVRARSRARDCALRAPFPPARLASTDQSRPLLYGGTCHFPPGRPSHVMSWVGDPGVPYVGVCCVWGRSRLQALHVHDFKAITTVAGLRLPLLSDRLWRSQHGHPPADFFLNGCFANARKRPDTLPEIEQILAS